MERDLVLRGLAENPAVPVGVLMWLLRDWPEPVAQGLRARVTLPLALQEHMAAHGSHRVRSALAGHARLVPEIRDRLLRSDPDWRVRALAFARNRQPLPDEALIRLMTDLLDPPDDLPIASHELFEQLFFTDQARVPVAVRHPDPRVRRFAVSHASQDDLQVLQADPDPQVVL